MPTIHFMGFVKPSETKLCIENLTPITEKDIDTGRIVTYTIAILDSVVSVECELDELNDQDISRCHTRAVEMSRALVNLISFMQGWGLVVHLDTLIHSDEKEETILSRADFLAPLVDAYDINDIDSMFQMIACDIDTSLAFHDLNHAIATPRIASVNCARVIDTVKNLLAPDMNGKAAWRIVHENLKVDESYLQFISMHSRTSRHGKHSYLSSEETQEILKRTWTIFNRYLYYRIHRQALPDRFERLTTPTPRS